MAQRQVVDHAGDDAGHVRGVALDGQVAAGIDGAGHRGQQQAQLPVGAAGALVADQLAQGLARHAGVWNGPSAV